jgi:hypothetical protein
MELRTDVYTDVDGAGIRWLRRAPLLSQANVRLFASRLELEVDPGVAPLTGQGSNPLVMQRLSWDGGRTFGSEETARVGSIGEYENRAVFRRNGSGHRLVPEYSGSEPLPWRLIDLHAQIGLGAH